MCEVIKARLGKRTMLSMWAPSGGRSHLTRVMKRTGRWYESSLLLAIKRLGVEGVFVDVGAHIGSHMVAFHDVCGASRVVAIEPYDRNIRYLRKNAVGRRATIVQTAVSSEIDFLRLDVPTTFAPEGFVLVEPDRIDDVLQTLDERDVALIKIDVAKHCGFDALQSAERTIERCHPVVAIEACEEPEHADVKRWLEARGYTELGCYEATPTYLYAVDP